MMRKIRKRMGIFLWLMIGAFVALIFFEWGMNYTDVASSQRGIIGSVNGTDVRYADFQKMYYNQTQQLQRQKGGESLTDLEYERISDEIWTQLTEEMVLKEYLDKAGIVASDSEIVFYLKTSPPDFLQQSPTFQTDGRFDPTKYTQALNNPAYAKEWTQIEQMLRIQLPFSKLEGIIRNSALVTESEIKTEYIEKHTKLNGQFLFFDPASYPSESITISDSDIKSYYEDHKNEYRTKASAKLKYVTFPIAATPEDTQGVLETLKDVQTKLAAGDDFSELAQVYSEDVFSARQGGSLGWFTKGRMLKPFEDACFAAKPGEITEPVQTIYGYHIIKVDEKRLAKAGDGTDQDSILASHILIKMEPSPNTISNVNEKALAFFDYAGETSFDHAFDFYQKDYELDRDTTTDFTNNQQGFLPGFSDPLRRVVRFAFSAEPGTMSSLQRTKSAFYVFELLSRTPDGYKPINKVKNQISETLKKEKQKEMALLDAEKVRKLGNSLNEIEKIDPSRKVSPLSDYTIVRSLPGVGRDLIVNGALLNLPVGELSQPIMGSRGVYLIQLASRTPFNEPDYKAQRRSLKQTILRRKQQSAYQLWITSIKERSEVDDNRLEFKL